MPDRRTKLVIVLVVAALVVAVAVDGRLGGYLEGRLLALRGAHGPDAKHRAASLPAAGADAVAIPFELAKGHVFLDVRVDDSGPLGFVLDTGDKFAVVDFERAQELELELGGSVRVAGIGSQDSTGAFVQDAQFTLAGFPGFSQPVTLAIPVRKLAPRIGRDFDGILGSDFIQEFVVEIDYAARVMRLHDQAKFVYAGPGEIVPMRLDGQGHPYFAAEVTLVGGEPLAVELTLDIGSGGSLNLFSPFVAEHRLLDRAATTAGCLGGAGTGGESTGRTGRVAALRIGSLRLAGPVAYFSQDSAGAFAASDVQGSIGAVLTRRFKLFLDYGRERIVFEPAADFAEPFEFACSGLAILAEGPDYRTFRIARVGEDSAGAEAGALADDVIAALNGRPARDWTLTTLSEILARPRACTLTVLRGGQPLELALTPRTVD